MATTRRTERFGLVLSPQERAGQRILPRPVAGRATAGNGRLTPRPAFPKNLSQSLSAQLRLFLWTLTQGLEIPWLSFFMTHPWT
jgi:hypothetical protein